MNLTKNERLNIYKKMLILAINDRKECIELFVDNDNMQFGLCWMLKISIPSKCSENIKDYPELIALKPKNKRYHIYWWSCASHSMTRINKLKKVIAEMETN